MSEPGIDPDVPVVCTPAWPEVRRAPGTVRSTCDTCGRDVWFAGTAVGLDTDDTDAFGRPTRIIGLRLPITHPKVCAGCAISDARVPGEVRMACALMIKARSARYN